MTGYTVREVASMLGLSASTVRTLARSGLVSPGRGPRRELRFSFQQLVILRAAGDLLSARIPPRRIQRTLRKLARSLPEGSALSGLRIAADGGEIVVRDGERAWHAGSGQLLFDFRFDDLVDQIAPYFAAKSQGSKGRSSAIDWYERGCELEETSVRLAQGAYLKAIDLDPTLVDAHVNLGRLLHQGGELEQAERHYQKALELSPSHAVAAFNLGVLEEDRGRIDQAAMAYQRSLAIDPKLADAHFNLGRLHERSGERAAALRHFRAYRELEK